MDDGIYEHRVSKVWIFSIFIFGLLGGVWIAPAQATPECNGDAAQAIQQARKALYDHSPKQDRAALECLVEAFAWLAIDVKNLRAQAQDGNSNQTTGRVIPRFVRTEEDE